MRINYRHVINQAGEIEDLGDDLKRIGDQLSTMIDDVPSFWSGDAASAYIQACRDLMLNIQATSREIGSISRDICQVADRIHAEDERMAQMANNLK